MRHAPILRHALVLLCICAGVVALSPSPADAVACARGVYRAGCVGPRGAVGVRRSAYGPRRVVVRGGYRRW